MNPLPSPHVPYTARITERIEESASIFTLRLRFEDSDRQAAYRFQPGQFNMLYLPGVGEAPISLSSDPEDHDSLTHTIRIAGRVTQGLSRLQAGDVVGLRGPYGHAWPLEACAGRDIVIVTGGLGCAPAVAVVHYVLKRRARFGRLVIVQGVHHARDLIWKDTYALWAKAPDTQVLIAARSVDALWPWHTGGPIELLKQAEFNPAHASAMICGPEGMMVEAAHTLIELGLPGHDIHLSLERNMQCAAGLCGHCQLGGKFVCRDGPVFAWPQVQALLEGGGL
jgi:sulfhydrogenase subunit gamma (sulfur reductase)